MPACQRSSTTSRFQLLVPVMVAMAVCLVGLSGCSSTYYAGMEKLGWHKRDLLVSRVEAARDEQAEAKEQFQTALEQFSSVVAFDGGNLEKQYKKLNSEFEDCERRANDVRDRIKSIDKVSDALFAEWEAELSQYSRGDLKQRSETKLRETRDRYDQLMHVMRRAEQKMDPVLAAFQDQVLYLKHNLNAQAISSLQGEVDILESEIADLVAEMEAAIAEADSFIETMG